MVIRIQTPSPEAKSQVAVMEMKREVMRISRPTAVMVRPWLGLPRSGCEGEMRVFSAVVGQQGDAEEAEMGNLRARRSTRDQPMMRVNHTLVSAMVSGTVAFPYHWLLLKNARSWYAPRTLSWRDRQVSPVCRRRYQNRHCCSVKTAPPSLSAALSSFAFWMA